MTRTWLKVWVLILLWLVFSGAALADGVRQSESLDSGWRFKRAEVTDGGAVALETKDWQKVDLPHSFNAADGTSDKYYRGPVWYRRPLVIGKIRPDERRFIEFDGAALASDVWINGKFIGRHEGGYARFRFDLTPFLTKGKNLIAVIGCATHSRS